MPSKIQAVYFDPRYWDGRGALTWLTHHNLDPIKKEPGKLRFRIREPDQFDHFTSLKLPNHSTLVLGWPAPMGAAFSPQAVEGLREFRAFQAAYRGQPRALVAALWKQHKALTRYEPEPLSPTQVEEYMTELAAEDSPKKLLAELLKVSQKSPCCFPYGLSLDELRSPYKLRSALTRAKTKCQ